MSATPLAFGRYTPYGSSPADFTATITVVCTAAGSDPVPFRGTVSLTWPGASTSRELSDGRHSLRYQLFSDPSRTAPWGDATGGSARPLSGIASPTAPFRETLTVYGRILARQSAASVGSYRGQIVAVLNY
jgi:spore coat protein U-like protein